MDLTHLKAFTAAMQRKDLEAMLTHMADDVTLKTPRFCSTRVGSGLPA